MITNCTEIAAYTHDFRSNNFANASAFGSFIQLVADDARAVNLLTGQAEDWEVISRSKFDGSTRPGAHWSPAMARRLARLFEELQDVYFRFAHRFDYEQVFSPILIKPG